MMIGFWERWMLVVFWEVFLFLSLFFGCLFLVMSFGLEEEVVCWLGISGVWVLLGYFGV